MTIELPIDAILATAPAPPRRGAVIGRSRQARPIYGYVFGRGPLQVSLIGGCHADEPVGPAMLEGLITWLAGSGRDHPLLERATLRLVPHVNPDGAAANARWSERTVELEDGGRGYELASYLRHAVREPPGDDVEFGFPRSPEDRGARPENLAVAAFLRPAAPFALHASFHGMAFAAGPWFLLERGWAERTAGMRQRLRARVHALGYRLHDVDRGGEKGFHRIDEGFTSRPDSRAMAAYFDQRGDPSTARLFRPSSMEFVRSLGGDPLTLVSEMPLFLLPASLYRPGEIRPPAVAELTALARAGDDDRLRRQAAELGVRPMPIADQMRLQLAYLDEALRLVGRT